MMLRHRHLMNPPVCRWPCTRGTQVNNFTFHYAFYVVMNWLPTYFDKVLRANLAELGPVKTLPYLIMFAMSNVGNLCGDWLISRGKWSVAAARKAVNTIGAGPAIARLLGNSTWLDARVQPYTV